MADEKWQKVREVFDSALRLKPDERQRFVREACAEDKTLFAEVESLLTSLGSAESFMETPAVAKVAAVIEAETKHLERGETLGHYEIIEQIGEGGMGEVYLAKVQNPHLLSIIQTSSQFMKSAKQIIRISSPPNTSKARLCANDLKAPP